MPAEAPLLLLRADAGPGIGSGHVTRLLALAEAWIDAGGRARLLTAAISKTMSVRAGALGVEIEALPAAHPAAADLAALKAAVAKAGPRPWVAVDGYDFDAAYYRGIREAGARLLAVDDVPRLPDYPVDVLVNQNAGAEAREYPLPPEALPLLGPRWALLRRDYAAKGAARALREKAARVLISFGAADPHDATSAAIRALRRVKTPYRAAIVVGPDNPRGEALEKLAAGAPIVFEKAANMPALMADSDLAVLAGGATMLEACVTGLPALVLTIASNQEPGAAALAKAGAVRLLGRAPETDEETLADAVDALLGSLGKRRELSFAGRRAVDGRGAARVAAVLLALSQDKLDADWVSLRPAAPADALEVWRIANDPDVRAHSFRREPIPLAAHLDWYGERLAAKNERFWLIDVAGAVAGQIRYAKDGDAAEVHYSVRAAFRGKGLGTLALAATRELACRELGTRRLTGVVIAPNPASERSFASAGWSRKGDETRDGKTCAVFEALCS
jgi:UDP-2,4-diacetamido-2,4,6-trideoxy-beta-L-altropyranose hydrolase